ncbi:hypothetical protein [Tenacibaculum finnmarkense]|uniref:hypothetical protein n=1 Tax=Tenacibaculum finnmarkense TaxID=2781243 RepID=UPI00187BBF49|nr:hypothetical protein [Tenacibaculum finnmarkense]MBE7692242.1 hypothetical protein [Tenacibaculum finnmarkense genomovar finnmarkense]
MKLKILLLLIIILPNINVFAQTEISVPKFIQLPKDSIQSRELISTLNKFLTSTQEANNDNIYVYPKDKIETYILIDEFKNIEKSRGFKNEHFYKPYLTNVIKLDSTKFLLQISHIGVSDSIPYLRSEFKLIAHKIDETFLFSSPLKENTKNWSTKTIDNFTFYFKNNLNIDKANNYVELSNTFDKKLKSKNKITKLYCAKNRTELLRLIGVDYKLDYNGRTSGVFSALNGNEQLIVLGNNNETFDNFDPHDLWHDRLSLVISKRKVNKPVDEGCSYLYGGSWGMSWDRIFKRFMKKVANNKDANWIYYKENKTNFGESQAEHLMVDYVVNALIIQKIEKEKGFSGVWELLNCGKYEKGNENYYNALNKITGISKKNYNKEIWKLIKNENSTNQTLN